MANSMPQQDNPLPPSGADDVIIVDDISFSYRGVAGTVPVLRELSLRISAGEVVGILGSNGSGKSTLLKIINGTIKPDSGQVHWRSDLRPSLLSLGAGFVSRLTGRENAILGLVTLGFPRSAAQEMTSEVAKLSGLKEAFDRPVHTYSSGMRARLNFSVAYHGLSDVLLIDEVLGVGDADFKRRSRELLMDQIAESRSAVIVSHNQKLLARLTSRVLVIANGSIIDTVDAGEIADYKY